MQMNEKENTEDIERPEILEYNNNAKILLIKFWLVQHKRRDKEIKLNKIVQQLVKTKTEFNCRNKWAGSFVTVIELI